MGRRWRSRELWLNAAQAVLPTAQKYGQTQGLVNAGRNIGTDVLTGRANLNVYSNNGHVWRRRHNVSGTAEALNVGIISVRAEGEHEQVLREESSVRALDDVLVRALESRKFALLQYIDPYGDTVFNRPQLQAVLAELIELSLYASNTAETEVIETVRQLADYCLQQPHRYLRFRGD